MWKKEKLLWHDKIVIGLFIVIGFAELYFSIKVSAIYPMNFTTYLGSPYPLGATAYENGVNFSIYSENAKGVDLCLFDDDGNQLACLPVQEVYHSVWHIFVADIKAGQHYGYRVHGDYEPNKGLRFNSNKLLIDPYAKALSAPIKWHNSLFGYKIGEDSEGSSFSEEDSAPFVPKSVVVDDKFDWENDELPKIPYHNTIIYEAHVRGFSLLHPDIPENIRGKYAAIAHPVTIQYLKDLNITAIELMPVHHYISDKTLEDKGLHNYWGYNTIGYFAPECYYATESKKGEQVAEFKNMVKELHKAGIEVILDVVYNHTAEGNQLGPTICFRGIDNPSYYRLEKDARYYTDYTGTGNTLNVDTRPVLRLIMDSLRYWILEMHVDGFRFDMAPVLARELKDVNMLSSFMDIIYQDPIISQAKLIAEPWDLGNDGNQVGNFPPGWVEWNGKFRDCVRDQWLRQGCPLGEFAKRFTGSPDIYRNDYRRPTASINLITAHDGFTLNDLVSYNEKHNEANKEDNKDGANENHSWNCGAEGPTDNNDINILRERQKRNLFTVLILSQGVPMITMGDEISKTQNGNNNAFCQNNDISWLQWDKADIDLLNFVKKLTALKKNHPSFCRRKWFKERQVTGTGLNDIAWFYPDSREMQETDWQNDFSKSITVYLNGKGIATLNYDGKETVDDCFMLMFNAYENNLEFTIPARNGGKPWLKVIDTKEACINEEGCARFNDGDKLQLEGRSIVVLRRP